MTTARLSGQLENRRLLSIWLMVFATLAWVPGGFTRFVFAKLLLVAVACLVGALVPRQGRLPRSIVLAGGASLAVLALAALVGETPVASLLGRWPRYEGLPVLAMYAASAWLGARVVGRGVPRLVQLAHALGAMSVTLCAFSLLELADVSPLGRSNLERSGSLLGNATDQGLVAMMAAVVVLGGWLQRRDRFLLAALAASLVTVAVSGSRIALALTSLALLVMVVRTHRRLALPVAGGAAAMLALALLSAANRERFASLATGRGRLEQWRLTLDLIADHPVLGVGPSRFVDAFGAYESATWVAFTGPRALADSPHNVLLQVTVAGGLLLLGCVVALAAVLVRRSLAVVGAQPESLALLVAVVAYAVALLGNPTSAGPMCLAAFLTGALVAETGTSPEEPGWRRYGLATLFGVAALVMLSASASEIMLARGVEAGRTGRVDEAVTGIEDAEYYRPFDGDLAMLGAGALASGPAADDARGLEEAGVLARRSLERTPETYGSLLVLGTSHLAAERPEEALEVLDEAVALYPFRADAYLQRALARSAMGDESGAESDRGRARELGLEPRG